MTTDSPGALPEGWSHVRFGDVVERVSETGIPTGEESKRYIGLEHMESGDLQIRSWGSEVAITNPKTRVRAGDVLFARRNTHLRRAAIAPFDTFYSPDGYAFRSSSPALLQSFLLTVVSADAFMDFAVRHSSGTHSKRVKWIQLQEYQFALPPLEEQKRIVELLETLRETRERFNNVEQAAQNLSEAYFRSKLEALQISPVPLSSLGLWRRGYSFSGQDYAPSEEGHPFLTLAAVSKSGGIRVEGAKWIRKQPPDKQCAPAGSILIANTDLTPGREFIGRPILVPTGLHMAGYSHHLTLIDLNDKSLNRWLFWELQAPICRDFLRSRTRGSTVMMLDMKSLGSLPIRVPDVSERNRILGALDVLAEVESDAQLASSNISKLYSQVSQALLGDPSVQ